MQDRCDKSNRAWLRTPRTWIAASLVVVSAGWAWVAHAATDGTLGATSTGQVTVSISVGDVVQLSKLSDITFANWIAGSGDVEQSQDVCVYSTRPGGDYHVTATSADPGPSGQFRLGDGGGQYIEYSLGWADSTGQPFASSTADDDPPWISGEKSIKQDNGSTTSTNCAGGTNASMSIRILQTDLTGKQGSFSDVLTLLLSPT